MRASLSYWAAMPTLRPDVLGPTVPPNSVGAQDIPHADCLPVAEADNVDTQL